MIDFENMRMVDNGLTMIAAALCIIEVAIVMIV